MIKAIPDGYNSVTPILVFRDASKAIDFYKRAFGAEVRFSLPGPDGKGVMHAELRIGTSIIMLGDENPDQSCKSAETLGSSPVTFYLYLENVDNAFIVAVNAGAENRMPVEDMFWGDRVGIVKDPYGYSWMLATRIKDLTAQEIQQGAQSACAKTKK